jgi:hypothetical protein
MKQLLNDRRVPPVSLDQLLNRLPFFFSPRVTPPLLVSINSVTQFVGGTNGGCDGGWRDRLGRGGPRCRLRSSRRLTVLCLLL